MKRLFAAVTVTLACASPLRAGWSMAEAMAAYQSLWSGRYATSGSAVPEGGQELVSDVASWRLLDGELRAMEPLADGTVAGCVFRGRGRFRIELPDDRERAHFARMSESPARDPVELEFTEMVLRVADGTCERLAGRPHAPFAPDRLAEERRRLWIERAFFDVEAALVRALAGDAPGLLVAEMRTADHGWLLYTYYPDLREEIGLASYHPEERVYEAWVSLDRAADRRRDGRAGPQQLRQFDLLDLDVEVDLRPVSKHPKAGRAEIVPRRARFEATLRLAPLRPELRSLALDLDVWSEVVAVRDEAGRPLAFLRDNVGKRVATLPKEVWDDSLLVLFDEPLGERERALTFVWERDLLNYAPGREWYPGEIAPHRDFHTATVALRGLAKHDLRAAGELVEQRDDGDGSYRRWRLDRPVRGVTFAFAEGFVEERVARPGAPEVVVLAPRGARSALREVGADVADAWSFFAGRFGPGPSASELIVVGIVGGHGQAFDGFLHLAETSFAGASRAPAALFRAHETAHQWWGQVVGRDAQRDLWLAEGFAEYSALLYVESALADGPALYREAIGSFAAEALGESKPSRFDRGFTPPVNPARWRRVGPIALGARAAPADLPSAYEVQTYRKGALVLHMLRQLLRAEHGDDGLFFAVLADFAREHRGREASIDDFVATVEGRAPGDWSWFFRQWIDETAIPSWEWWWRPSSTPEGQPAVTLEIEQRDAPPGFRMPVPVEVRLAGGGNLRQVVLVDEARERFTLTLPAPARDVVLDPDWAVLARRRER